MIRPLVLWQLARQPLNGAVPSQHRVRRAGRRRATDDVGLAAALAGRPRDFAVACRAALEDLERSGGGIDAEQAFREIATALGALAGGGRLDAVLTSRTNRATATCDAPNCAGHRTRA
jgi:hypothetical protein